MAIINTSSRKCFFFCLFFSISCSYISCSHSENNNLGNYLSETIKINPDNVTEGLKLGQYRIDSICPLAFPDGMELHEITKVYVKNERIYIMDSRLDKTIFVFDSSGDFLFKAGERGRAKNEYIEGPADFFVDNDDNIHVFDNRAKKILIFDKSGKVRKVVDVIQYFPNSFGMMADRSYVYDFNLDKFEENTVLARCDANNIIKEKLLSRSDSYTFIPSFQTFFANENRLSHIPLLADSVLVFNSDSLEKVVKFDFGGKYIMQENPSLVIDLHKPEEISAYKGVRALLSYQETDNLILLNYVYQSSRNYWLYNKDTEKVISGPFLFEGLSPFTNYFIKGKQIISVISDEQVSINESDPDFENDIYRKNYKNSAKQMQDIYDGKTNLPAVVFISIK